MQLESIPRVYNRGPRGEDAKEACHNPTWLLGGYHQGAKMSSIEKWILFGGSWGSTLALYYAINYPERCCGMVLRGVFLGTRAEIDWFLCGMRKSIIEPTFLVL